MIIYLIYTVAIVLYCAGIRVAALFNKKADQWVKGRMNWRNGLRKSVSGLSQKTIWIHCSSLGEFEQARPLIDGLKMRYPEKSIILSFFSPSGYNIRNNYKYADHVCYLPCDLPGAASDFIHIIRPELVIFVKYDLWLGYFRALNKMKIPFILVSVLQNNRFNLSPGDLFKLHCYSRASSVYVQNQQSFDHLKKKLRVNIKIAGDTRIDSVLQNAHTAELSLDTNIKNFLQNQPCLICGSTWPEDEKLLIHLINDLSFPDWKVIIAPHEMHSDKLKNLKESFGKRALFYSNILELTNVHTVLIIDSIGFLSKLYRYGTIAYIGGGFGRSIHNTLEPAAFNLPVIFGPAYKKFMEAVWLVNAGAFVSVQNKEQLLQAFSLFKEENSRESASKAIDSFFNQNKGGSQIILEDIKTNYLSAPNS